MHEAPSLRRSAAAFVAAALLAACSSADDGAQGGDAVTGRETPVPDAAAPASTAGDDEAPIRRIDPREGGLDVGFGEFAITLEADEIRPGPVTFVIRNGGALVHGFEIEGEEDDDGDNSGSGNGELKLEGPEFGPNDVVRIRADLPPGIYEIECFVAEHDDRGMRTTLVVTTDAPLVRKEGGATAPDEVEIADFAFTPPELHVTAGTEVTWTNTDPAPHTVTADGEFDSDTLDPNEGFSFRFDVAGTFSYACLIHPTMRGTVHVA
jgi:plastocyanin